MKKELRIHSFYATAALCELFLSTRLQRAAWPSVAADTQLSMSGTRIDSSPTAMAIPRWVARTCMENNAQLCPVGLQEEVFLADIIPIQAISTPIVGIRLKNINSDP